MALAVGIFYTRLTRFSGLDFTAKALHRSLDNPTEELSASFTAAYENSLRKYHSIVVRPLFSVRVTLHDRRRSNLSVGYEGLPVSERFLR